MTAVAQAPALPRWATVLLLPAINLAAALLLSGLVVLAIGEDPLRAVRVLVAGALGYPEAIGFTLYYATNFLFTGLAVAVAFHAGLFNIGGEGQAYVGGLGIGLVALALGGWPLWLTLPACVVAGATFGAAWAFVPGWLQATRGSHVVVTTIMFNFLASALMVWLLVDVLIAPGQQSPETRQFDSSTWLPPLGAAFPFLGQSPANMALFLALGGCGLFHLFIWHTRWGYELRSVGHNSPAAVYAGIPVARTVMLAMALSGAFAGCLGINELLGAQHRILVNFPGGAGFVGIAVALMGRNHAAGMIPAALLFGALTQGGSELSFEMPAVTRDLVVVIQGLIILFCGALENLFRRPVEALFHRPAPGAATP